MGISSSYTVGEVDTNACKRITSISHTCHVSSALQILDADEIRASLVYDKSVLNEARVLVSWLSPNHWANGYRYGNIQFQFDFAELVQGKRYYWVEAIDEYKPHALRILITDKIHDELSPYDPKLKDGPWWFDTSSEFHYYNGDYCLEFMFEEDISLGKLKGFEFVDHHRTLCSVQRYSSQECTEKLLDGAHGGAVFLARAVAVKSDFARLRGRFERSNGRPNDDLDRAFFTYLRPFSRPENFTGSIAEDDERAEAVARAAMGAYAFGFRDEAKSLAHLFRADRDFERVTARMMSEAVAFEAWEELLPGEG